jgi:hypothetical protein
MGLFGVLCGKDGCKLEDATSQWAHPRDLERADLKPESKCHEFLEGNSGTRYVYAYCYKENYKIEPSALKGSCDGTWQEKQGRSGKEGVSRVSDMRFTELPVDYTRGDKEQSPDALVTTLTTSGDGVATDGTDAVDLCLSSIGVGSKSKRDDLVKMGLEKMRVEVHDAVRSNSPERVKELFCVLDTADKNKLLRDDFGGDLTMPPTVAAVLGRKGVASMGAWEALMNEATCDGETQAAGCVSRLELLTAKAAVKGSGGKLGEHSVDGKLQGWNAFLLAARTRPIKTVVAILGYIGPSEEVMKEILGSVTEDGCNALVAVGRSKRGVEARKMIASVIARGFGKDQCEGASGKYKSLCADTRLKLLTATCTPAGGSWRSGADALARELTEGRKVGNAC